MELDREGARLALIERLRRAHAGELAAALAYGGHWRSLRRDEERARVREIELDELRHREDVGRMLAELGAEPDARRERRFGRLGTLIALFCRVGGWLAPMYGAGRLESGNVREYEDAARLAVLAGHRRFAPRLLEMAEVEWDHEYYFRAKVRTHPLGRLLPRWEQPGARELIRESFEEFLLAKDARLPPARAHHAPAAYRYRPRALRMPSMSSGARKGF